MILPKCKQDLNAERASEGKDPIDDPTKIVTYARDNWYYRFYPENRSETHNNWKAFMNRVRRWRNLRTVKVAMGVEVEDVYKLFHGEDSVMNVPTFYKLGKDALDRFITQLTLALQPPENDGSAGASSSTRIQELVEDDAFDTTDAVKLLLGDMEMPEEEDGVVGDLGGMVVEDLFESSDDDEESNWL